VSALVNHVTQTALTHHDFETVSNTLGATAVGLLIVLLILHELVRAAAGELAARRLRALWTVTVPLFASAIVIEAARFAYVIL
jgi:ABC-type spermidine/putrescine transport system permease subunit I